MLTAALVAAADAPATTRSIDPVVSSPASTAASAPAATEPTAGPVSLPNLLADGSGRRFWIAQVSPLPAPSRFAPAGAPVVTGDQTIVYVRADGGETWYRLAQLQARAVDIAHRGDQLALLLQSGEWMLLTPGDGTVTGTPLPVGGRIRALGYDQQTLWAVGEVAGGMAAIARHAAPTSSTTRAGGGATTTTTTGPSIQSADPKAVLFSLGAGGWEPREELPPEIGPGTLNLAIVDRTTYIAVSDASRTVRVFQRDSDHWALVATVESVEQSRLFSTGSSPVLWVAARGGADSLYFLNDAQKPLQVKLAATPKGEPEDRTAGFAVGRIRSLSPASTNPQQRSRIIELDYDAQTGASTSSALTITLPMLSVYPEAARAIWYVIWAALLFAIVSSLRWRRLMQGMSLDLDALHLAPPLPRLIAGLIDLSPLLLAFAMELTSLSLNVKWTVLACGALVYLLHTSLAEVFLGRSFGKMCTGLSIISLNGERPGAASMIIRNFLRVIDIGLMFLPLVVIFFSPLRQRTGDVAAGTLVVRKPKDGEPQAPNETGDEPPTEDGPA